MAKPNFVKRRAKEEGLDEIVLIEKLLSTHEHSTPAVAGDIGVSNEAMWMWLTAHGYEHQCRWVRVSESSVDFDGSRNERVTEKSA